MYCLNMQLFTKNLSDNFKYYKKKLKNSDIKISERLKNIKELDDSLLRIIEKNKNKIYMIKQ